MAARGQLPKLLEAAPCCVPPRVCGRDWLGGVECCYAGLDVRGYDGGDALEPVRGERAAKAEPTVDVDDCVAVVVPPEEALRPQVGMLHGAEAICRFRVDYEG